MTTKEWLQKEGYAETMVMSLDNLAIIIDRYKHEILEKGSDETDVEYINEVPEWISTKHRRDMLKELWNTPNINDSNPRIKAIRLAASFAEEYGYKISIKKAIDVIKQYCL